jgi:hypothetical protein
MRAYQSPYEVGQEIERAMLHMNRPREMQLREVYAAATGRYNYHAVPSADLCVLFAEDGMMPFETWLHHYWSNLPVQNY